MGTVAKRGDKHRAMVRKIGHEPRYKTFDTKKEATAWIADVEREMRENQVTDPKIDIGKLIEAYVRDVAPKRKMAKSHLNHDVPSVKRVFKDMKMSDLQGRGLTQWVLKQSTAASTRNWHIARLFGILRQVETHLDVNVPWADMKRARDKMWDMGMLEPAGQRDRRVTDDELDMIKAAISERSTNNWNDLFDFCLTSAMRIAEVCRIEWKDFDEVNRTVIVRDRKHPRKKFGNHQVVPLLNGAFEIAARQPRKGPLIFPRRTEYCSRVFHAAALKAGLENIVLHDLRHEGISRLFELGYSIPEVALVSGHTNWRTLRRYANLKPIDLHQGPSAVRALRQQQETEEGLRIRLRALEEQILQFAKDRNHTSSESSTEVSGNR